MLRLLFAVGGLIFLLTPDAASAWGYQGHRVTGSIAPFDLGDARTRELMDAARAVPPSVGTNDDWAVN